MIDLKGYDWMLVDGARMTVIVAILSMLVAMALGLIGAMAKLSKSRIGYGLADTYTTVIRGVPELVLLTLIYFGLTHLLQELVGAISGGDQRIDINPFVTGVLTIGLVYGAFTTEVFRGAFLAVPKGQIEAAKACGMGRLLVLRRILLPQVWRFALPGLGNVWLVLLKATALMSVVNLDELTRRGGIVSAATKIPFTVFSLVGLAYIGMTIVSMGVLQLMERRANRGVRRA
jgi:His/Glu/Gln/Arg/opine family amino acid ABC transporter permease subunit